MKSLIIKILGLIKYTGKHAGGRRPFSRCPGFGLGLGLFVAGSVAASAQQIINLDVVVGVNHPSNSLPVFKGQGVLGTVTNNYWNGFQGGIGGMYGLLDSVGQPTTVCVLTWGYPASIGANNTWSDPGTAGTSFYTTNTLLGDYVYTSAGSYICVSLEGLTTNATYTVVCYSAPNSAIGTINYTNGWTASCTPTTRTNYIVGNNYVINTSVVPDTNGTFSFMIGPSAVFNGLQIQQNAGSTNLLVKTGNPGNTNGVATPSSLAWVSKNNGQMMTLNWTNGVLESTPALEGSNTIWTPVSTNGPFSIPFPGKNGSMFYRVGPQ